MCHEPVWMKIDASKKKYFSEILGPLHMVSELLVTTLGPQGSIRSLFLFLKEKSNEHIYYY
jgi:hypothetical protein